MANERMSIEKFLPLYLKAVEAGLTKEEFAKKIGVLPATVYQRVYELRHEGLDIPLLKSEGRRTKLEKARAILEELRGPKGTPGAKVKPSKPKAEKPKASKAAEEVAEEPVLDSEESQEDALAKIFG